jgi:Flp pilus assembly protein TadG
MMRARLHPILRSERGAAVIEMALIAPVLALMVIGIVDISNAFSHKLAIEQGAQRAIERIMQTTASDTVENTLKTEVVCQVNGANTDGTCKTGTITTADVTVTYRLECTAGGGTISVQTSASATAFDAFVCPGGTVSDARYIEVGVNDKYTPLFPIRFTGFNTSNGTYPISATAGMRTQ